jgi:hypothetical protein
LLHVKLLLHGLRKASPSVGKYKAHGILSCPWRSALGRHEAELAGLSRASSVPGDPRAVGWGDVSAEHVAARPGAYADPVTLGLARSLV